MNDLLWLPNHPLRANVMGNTSRAPNTPEGLESRLFDRASALDRTRVQKTPSNPNGFRQSFRARATPRTPDKPGSPPALRTLPLSLLYKEWTWEHYRKLNLTFFTPFAGRSMGVFIGGLSQCFGWKWGLRAHFSSCPTSMGGWAAKFLGHTNFGHHRPTPPIFLDTCMK
jgi:hypothetical protein